LKEYLSEMLKGLDKKKEELERIWEFEVMGNFAGKTSGERRESGKERIGRELKERVGLRIHF